MTSNQHNLSEPFYQAMIMGQKQITISIFSNFNLRELIKLG
jgi:hypothetical protein